MIAALRDRAVYRHELTGATPAPLQSAVAEFNHELSHVKRRSSQLPR